MTADKRPYSSAINAWSSIPAAQAEMIPHQQTKGSSQPAEPVEIVSLPLSLCDILHPQNH